MSEFFGRICRGSRYRVDEIVAEGDDYLVVITSLSGLGAASRAPLRLRWVNAVLFRDGLILRSTGFLSKREALRAVGLGA
jgi:hypothetical protein